NADPVGATFDDNALNQDDVDGRPLYAGVTYDAGAREDRISSSIEAAAAGGALTLDDMSRIQHDTRSNVGFRLAAPIVAALDAVGFFIWRLDDNQLVRLVNRVLNTPGGMVLSSTTGQPILCDRIATAGPDDSCTKQVLVAMAQAMNQLGSQFGTADTSQWRWG